VVSGAVPQVCEVTPPESVVIDSPAPLQNVFEGRSRSVHVDDCVESRVENGRVVLDEHVDLAEGAALEVDGLRVVDPDDGIPAGERQRILRAMDEGLLAARRGEHVDADEFINELLVEP